MKITWGQLGVYASCIGGASLGGLLGWWLGGSFVLVAAFALAGLIATIHVGKSFERRRTRRPFLTRVE